MAKPPRAGYNTSLPFAAARRLMPTLKPFLLERKTLPKVWGGRALKKVVGIDLPGREAIGETWELFDRPEGSSKLRRSRTTIAELMQTQRKELLGARAPAGRNARFPLLLKFLDAQDVLSVQVHPDDAQAKAAGGKDGGKSEAWVVLHAGPKASMVLGLLPGVSEAEFRSTIEKAAVDGKAAKAAVVSLLRVWKPRTGDTVDVPAGMVHAIGPDVVVFEVQQNSDTTYRLYDWGRDRPLQVQEGLAATDFAAARTENGARPVVVPTKLADGGVQLVTTPHFRVVHYDLEQSKELMTQRTFRVVTTVAGRGTLGWRIGKTAGRLRLGAGDTALVPACIDRFVLSPQKRLVVLVTDSGVR